MLPLLREGAKREKKELLFIQGLQKSCLKNPFFLPFGSLPRKQYHTQKYTHPTNNILEKVSNTVLLVESREVTLSSQEEKKCGKNFIQLKHG